MRTATAVEEGRCFAYLTRALDPEDKTVPMTNSSTLSPSSSKFDWLLLEEKPVKNSNAGLTGNSTD